MSDKSLWRRVSAGTLLTLSVKQLGLIHRPGSVYDAFELCISLVAETYKKHRIGDFYTNAIVDLPPTRDWRLAASHCKSLTENIKIF